MNKLDYLIHDIEEQEVIEIEGALTEDARKRVEDKILKKIASESPVVTVSHIITQSHVDAKGSNVTQKHLDATDSGCTTKTLSAKGLHSKRLVLLLAATMVMMLGLTAAAAKRNDWDIALLNFMGISNGASLQLESGEVQINEMAGSHCVDYGTVDSGVERDVTVTAASSIGDKNEVYIRIETDYILPEDFNPETDYILPGEYHMNVSPNKSGYGSIFTFFTEGNRLGFLLSISNCEDVNRSTISLQMEDFYLYHDLNIGDSSEETLNESAGNPHDGKGEYPVENTPPEKELLCEGSWDLSWQFRYESNTETYRMLHPFENNGVTYYLTKVEISPISIRMEAFRMPQDRQKPHPTDWLEEIHLTDGSVIPIAHESSAGLKNGMFADSYVGIEVFGDALIPENVEKIVIMGRDIELR